jgi:predicted nucleic acid-binding protein
VSASAQTGPGPTVVIDTNVVLDLWLFDNPDVAPLRRALESGRLHWIACERMFGELPRVLAYAHLQAKLGVHLNPAATPLTKALEAMSVQAPGTVQWSLTRHDEVAQGIVACMQQWAKRCEVAPLCHYKCKDPDDQVFVDLAAAHGATLLSKDKAVLKLKNRLARLGSRVLAARDSTAWLLALELEGRR